MCEYTIWSWTCGCMKVPKEDICPKGPCWNPVLGGEAFDFACPACCCPPQDNWTINPSLLMTSPPSVSSSKRQDGGDVDNEEPTAGADLDVLLRQWLDDYYAKERERYAETFPPSYTARFLSTQTHEQVETPQSTLLAPSPSPLGETDLSPFPNPTRQEASFSVPRNPADEEKFCEGMDMSATTPCAEEWKEKLEHELELAEKNIPDQKVDEDEEYI